MKHALSILLCTVPLVFFIREFRRWWRHGKDFRGKGIIVPEYGPPKGIDVLSGGVLADYSLDGKDLTAAIVDLAVKGYLQIVEEQQKKTLRKDTLNTKLVLKKTDLTGLSTHQQQLLKGLFSEIREGAIFDLGTYSSSLGTAKTAIQINIRHDLTTQGFFDKDPGKTGSAGQAVSLIVLALFTYICIANELFLPAILGGLAIGACILFWILMPRRSRVGVEVNDQLKGLKLYLETAEKDRLKMTQSVGAKYAANANEPVRTVQLFEKLLPFAIIFGVEQTWAKQFANLYSTPPDWYQGNWSTFNTAVLASHISSSTANAVNSSFTAPSSSSGSGFSGGGGSGGGGGGGGGGGW